MSQYTPQVKICGITRVEDALGCVSLGADAIGCVFYPKSPRYLTLDRAREICSAVSKQIKIVGVFVNASFSRIMKHVEYCHLTSVQLHGHESFELVQQLRDENLHVIKALFVHGIPSLEDASEYPKSVFLVECGQGKLPGGNALVWNWARAKRFGEKHPLIIAGGLDPENVAQAIHASVPDAVDVSSGVEFDPGKKDLDKVKAFMDTISYCGLYKNPGNIFGSSPDLL